MQADRKSKIVSLAPYLPCAADDCQCRGWRPREDASTMDKANQESACLRCTHALKHHGGVGSMADDKLDSLIGKLRERLALRKAEEAAEAIALTLPETPPYETPSIVDIFRFYLLLAYSDAQAQQEQRKRLNELCNLMLTILDQSLLGSVSPQLQQDKNFAPYYQRWQRSCADGSNLLTRVFGRGMLLQLASLLMMALKSPSVPLQEPLREFAPKFLESLILEVRNAKSPLFRADALEVLSQRQVAMAAADVSRRNSLSRSFGSGGTRLSFGDGASVLGLSVGNNGSNNAMGSSNGGGGVKRGNDGFMEGGVAVLAPTVPIPPPKLVKLTYPEGICFKVVQNDSTPEALMRLTDMKQIFHKQLPKMPKTYISRLVFDLEHKTLVCMLDGRSIGGITFRPFQAQQFVEITFCAVTTDRQVRGYGSLIMTHLKAYCQKEGMCHFLTYADSFAVGYFSKQGFSAKVTLPREVWAGRIKDYDGATLMHCLLHPTLNYVEFQKSLAFMRDVTEERMDKLSGGATLHKGLTQFKGKKKKERIEDLAAIPGVLESGWDPQQQSSSRIGEEERLYEELDVLLQAIKRHSYAWPFKEAVDRQQVPNYYKVISDPIDLSMIEERLKSRTYYVKADLFTADLRRMLQNCKEFNNVDSSYHKCAVALSKFIEEKVAQLKKA